MKAVTRLPRLPRRKSDTHKGDYGRALVVAGSYGMAGAAMLACEGALRSGAGIVYLAAPRSIYDAVASRLRCVVIHPQPATASGAISAKALKSVVDLALSCNAVAIGPGLGTDSQTVALVHRLLGSVSKPMVLDADGLNAAAKRPAVLREVLGPLVMTPHPGEMARLIGRPVRDRVKDAVETARRFKSVVVLKGHGTVVTDGERLYVNRSGNPGMAKGGSGDVLTGVIAALIGQGLGPFDAACLGVYEHGRAGDRAAKARGEIGMTADDVVDHLWR